MEMFSSRRLTKIGLTAALYVVTTLLSAPLAYETIQFRVSEMLMLLCYFNKDFIFALSVGCFISNLFSSLGMIDMLFGTTATVISAVLMYLFRERVSMPAASLLPVIINALMIGLEIKLIIGDPFWINAGFVALGEFVCVSVLGVIVFKLLSKNKLFMKLITSGENNAVRGRQ